METNLSTCTPAGTSETDRHSSVPETNRYRISIDLLNDAIGRELSSTLQYMYFHARFEDDRYRHLAQIMREVAIAEMLHIEQFADRILYLEGEIDMNPSFRTRPMTDPVEMLQFALRLEESTVEAYNEASRLASEQKDAVTHKLFQDTIAEEETHLDTFRTELQNLQKYGGNYLALQSVAGSKQAARELHKARHAHEGDE